MFEREYAFKGKHATYVKKLSEVLFPRYIDVYIIAPIVGLYYNRTASIDETEDDTAKIFAEQLVAERKHLEFAYKLVILCYKNDNFNEDFEKRIERVFSTDEEVIKENMKIFNEYVLGGIEVLYEKIIEENDGDYIGNFVEFVNDFQREIMVSNGENKLSDSTLIKEILKDY
ncbi:MAG: hypothetical protein JG775_2595 [Defluviitaleaceae bacterium]|jgi:hypothetical protein|uniref:hypothetical protein n=1 Tax=Thermosipho sp. (in: thermotogales) TaxID=1968895 RepID=UPI000EE0E396|nr:hypothetical protein [Thermosipho sp. (in: thermotogales)]MBZ4669442.1 hypothetical protein [Defluviitaleaceae bacterium]MDK2814308.1 hypothetical protein [Thermoanaerobacter sp.]MBZ4650445.1 hypothetical protein [Thermosipho sp. (in: thermotogales)]MDK2840118.1 hypothetical protein [Thermosipho sp. (in: thermotogales)]HAA81074.1 hypothetical protein [Thermoanaerobacter sp.]